MNAAGIEEIVKREIGAEYQPKWPNSPHPREGLVAPRIISVIERTVAAGLMEDEVIEVWLVFAEHLSGVSGYRIVADINGESFGLATPGFATDQHLVLCGWYGSFLTTFEAM